MGRRLVCFSLQIEEYKSKRSECFISSGCSAGMLQDVLHSLHWVRRIVCGELPITHTLSFPGSGSRSSLTFLMLLSSVFCPREETKNSLRKTPCQFGVNITKKGSFGSCPAGLRLDRKKLRLASSQTDLTRRILSHSVKKPKTSLSGSVRLK